MKNDKDRLLYQKAKNYIMDYIEDNKLKPGDVLPTESKLEKLLNVSRTTIRHAISELQYQGYVEKKQGKGTFVADKSYEEQLPALKSFTEDARARGMSASSIVLEKEVILANDNLAQKLEISKNEKVLKLFRIRCLDDDPIQTSESCLPVKEIEGLKWGEIDFSTASLYDELEKAGIIINSGEERIKIDLASKKDERLLDIEGKSPIFVTERKIFNNKGTIIEYSISRTKGNRHS